MEDPKILAIRAEAQISHFVGMLFAASLNRSIVESRTIALKASTASVDVWPKKGGAA